MENKLFLLEAPEAPAGGGTRIVLNRQSDLILTNALITNPSGLTQSDIDGLIPHLASVESDVAAEITARENAVEELSEKLTEKMENADAELQSSINVEKGRIDAILDGSDVNLDQFVEVVNFVQAIDLENDASLLGAVTSIETKHDAEVSAEISSRESADASIESYFQEEIDEQEQGRVANAINISAEESSRIAADASVEQAMGEYVDSNMKAEIGAREAADTSLEQAMGEYVDSNMKAEIGAREAADSYLEQKIDEEVTRARNEDDKHDTEINAINVSISAEASTRENAIDAAYEKLSEKMENADAELQSSINVVEERIEAILDGSTVDLDQFSEVVAFVQAIDLENDASLLGAVTSIESKHDAEVSAEISNRVSADDSVEYKMVEYVDSSTKESNEKRAEADKSLEELIGSEMKQEQSEREDADSYLEQKIDEEVTRARNEDDKHDTEINAINVSISAEASTRELIDEAIKAGVNAALVEIKDMIIHASQEFIFKPLQEGTGDGVTTTFTAPVYGSAAVYLNGLLQTEGLDYEVYGSVDEKGNPSVDYIFNTAPDNGSKIMIWGQVSHLSDDNAFGDATPLV